MTRFVSFVVALLALAPAARGGVEVAPPPREVRPDGTRAAVPDPPGPAEDPAETVGRIITTSKAVGERLAKTDAGPATRTAQDTILKDIDALLNPPTPPSGGGGGDDKKDQKNPDQKPDDKKSDGGKSDSPPKKDGTDPGGTKPDSSPKKDGSDPGGMGSKGGNQQAKGERRPRSGAGQQPKDTGMEPGMGGTAGAGPKPQPKAGGKDPGGGAAGTEPTGTGGGVGGKAAARPSLPFDDEVVKEVWGHLPDKLRQQVTQYYKEQFMPKYSDLLRRYYSSLAAAPGKGGERK